MTAHKLLVAAVLLLALAVCDRILRAGAEQHGAVVSLDGEWEGTINYRYQPARFYLSGLVQSGTTVTGKSRIIGAVGPPGPERSVEGTIDGSRLSLSIPSLAYAGYDLIIEGDTVRGTYRSTSGEVAPLQGSRKRK